MTNALTVWDWLVVLAYFAAMLGIGFFFARRQKTTDHYFTAGGRIPGWAAGLSIYATLLSSFIFIAFPGQTYDRDWQVMMQQFTVPFIVVGVAIFIIPVFRRVIRVSAYEYLERRFGYAARVYGTVGFLADHFFKMAVVMSTLGLALHNIAGWNQDAIVVGLGIATIAYTFVGGIEGVVWTDVAQGLLMIVSCFIILAFIVFFASPEGPEAVLAASLTPEKLKLIDTRFSMTDQTVWVILWFGVTHFLMRYVTDQTLVQRYLTAPTLREARKSAFISVGACVIAWIAFPLIGTLLYGFYRLHPERLSETIRKGDQVVPYFVGQELPPGFVGLVLVGLFAASMSTISSELNSFGACVVSDFYARFAGGISDRRKLWASRAVVLCAGCAAVALAAYLTRQSRGIMELVLDVWAIMGALLGGGLLAAFFLGFFCPRANRIGLYWGLGGGLIFVAWCLATQHGWIDLPSNLDFLEYRWHKWWLMGFSNVLVFVLGYGISRLAGSGELAPAELVAVRQKEARSPLGDSPAPRPVDESAR